jgi:hypothetical protein
MYKKYGGREVRETLEIDRQRQYAQKFCDRPLAKGKKQVSCVPLVDPYPNIQGPRVWRNAPFQTPPLTSGTLQHSAPSQGFTEIGVFGVGSHNARWAATLSAPINGYSRTQANSAYNEPCLGCQKQQFEAQHQARWDRERAQAKRRRQARVDRMNAEADQWNACVEHFLQSQ